MILFTIFILTDFWKLPCILYSIPGIRANSFKRTEPIPFQGFSSTAKLFFHGRRRRSPSVPLCPARPAGPGRGQRAVSPLLFSLRSFPRARLGARLGGGGYATGWPRPGGAGRAGRAAPPLRPGRALAGGTAAAAASGRWGRSGPIKAGPGRGCRARRGGGSGAAPRGGWWPS